MGKSGRKRGPELGRGCGKGISDFLRSKMGILLRFYSGFSGKIDIFGGNWPRIVVFGLGD